MVTALLITVAAVAVSVVTLGREKAQLRTAFGQYVQGSLVEKIIDDPSKLKLGGERRELTVMFSDIRGFSKFSETLDPESLSRLLNEYLTPMTDQVFEHGGMLDKYIGDAVMAVYGAPLPMDEKLQAEKACATALAWMAALEELNKDWGKRDIPPVAIGVGINTGAMAVGNMGSENRFDYTVLGDAVNLAARLEAITKEYRAWIITGPRTRELAGERYAFRELDAVRVQGRDGVVPIYELLGPADAPRLWAEDIGLYEQALEAYRSADWDQAEAHFEKFLGKHPDDGAAQTMVTRIANMRTNPPPKTWDGVYDQKSK
jgi:adenylate cyclase